jgi:hypothetical protein
MKLWSISNPLDSRYAQANYHGTWKKYKCLACNFEHEIAIQPTIIEWLESTSEIADFTHVVKHSTVLVKNRVFSEIKKIDSKVSSKDITFYQNEKLEIPSSKSSRLNKRVWLPQHEIDLLELVVPTIITPDLQRSSIEITEFCEICNRTVIKITDVERKDIFSYSSNSIEKNIPRVAGRGIFISNQSLQNTNFFRIHEKSRFILCTDTAKESLESLGYSNLTFLNFGETF